MLVKFINPHFKYSYFPGDMCELTDEDAKRLIESGHVEAVEEKPEKPAKSKQK